MNNIRPYKGILLLMSLFCSLGNFLYSQSLPVGGDIVFTEFQTDADAIEFITLKRLDLSNASITDNGILSTNLLRTGEGTYVLSTSLTDIPEGTFVRFSASSGTNDTDASDGIITFYDIDVTGSLINLSTSGDQIIAYRGLSTSPTYLAGINGANSGWTTGAISTADSKAPGTTSDYYTGGLDDAKMTATITASNAAAIRSACVSSSNWTTSNNNLTPQLNLKNVLFNQSDYSSGAITFSSITSTGFTINCSGLAFLNTTTSTRYVVVINATTAPSTPMDRFTCYSGVTGNYSTAPAVVTASSTPPCGGTTTGSGKVVYFGYGLPSSLVVSGLTTEVTYQVRVYAMNGNGYSANLGTAASGSQIVAVAPTINTNPTSISVCEGSGFVLTSGAYGVPTPTVQWQKYNTTTTIWDNISGATGTSYSLSSTTLSNAGDYRAVYTNSQGSTNTATATITIDQLGTISEVPTDAAACSGSPMTTMFINGTYSIPPSWQVSTNGGTSWMTITSDMDNYPSGGSGNVLTIWYLDINMDGYLYRVAVTNACGVAYSEPSTLYVYDSSSIVSVIDHPDSETFCGFGSTQLTVAGTNTFSYLWQVNSGSGWSNITDGGVYSGSTTNALDISNVVGLNGYQYRCNLSNPCYPSGTNSNAATLTVNPYPTVNFAFASQNSIGGETGTINITVQLSNTCVNEVSVPYTLGSGTATNGVDFSLPGNSLVIGAGASSANIVLSILPDAIDEYDETVIINLGTPTNGVLGTTTQHTLTIIDDDVPPLVTLSVSPSTISENGGISTVTATLNTVSGKDVTVNLGFTGTATGSGTDYTVSGSSIVITAGNTSGTITVTGVDDSYYEGTNETVIVDITSVTNGTESGTQQQTITISDDETTPTVSLSVSPTVISENGGVATVTATLSNLSVQNVTVYFSFSGTATGGGTDYTTSASQVTINSGSSSGSITITGVDDASLIGDLTVIIDISNVTNGNEFGTQSETLVIADDESATFGSIAVDRQAPENTYSAQELVENVLVTGCLTASNITFTGNTNQIGYFTKGSSSFPIAEGIILSTGNVADAEGPNYDYNTTTQYGGAGDSQLNAEAGLSSSNDAAILEFDFVPAGDMIEFNYVFASEEYAEYVGEQYNDAFAFFLSGPGITGTINIALIPNTSTPVAINNVHGQGATLVSGYPDAMQSYMSYPSSFGHSYSGGSYGPWTISPTSNSLQPPLNSEYYVDNGHFTSRTDGALTWANGNGGLESEFDGRTTLLTASHAVTPCGTYHIKIVVVDAVDDKWDSGVFLEGRSFTSNEVQISSQIEGISGDANDMYEGCDGSFIRFQRAAGADNSSPFEFSIILGGTATNGTDYVYVDSGGNIIGDGTFPSTATIPAGLDYVDYFYKAESDGAIEGDETVIFRVDNSCPCATETTYYEKEVTIIDVPQIQTSTVTTTQCLASGNPEATITVVMQGGLDPANYEYSLYPSTNPEPTDPLNDLTWGTTYTFTITSSMPDGSDIVGDSYDVYVRDKLSCNYIVEKNIIIPNVEPFNVIAGNDVTMCKGQSGVTVTASGSIYYGWSSSVLNAIDITPYLSATNVSSPTILNTIPAGTYTLIVTGQDQAGASPACQGKDSLQLVVNQSPSVTVTANSYSVCTGTPVQLSTSVTNGGSSPTYLWNPTTNLSSSTISNPIYTPNVSSYLSQTFSVTVTADNGCPATGTSSIIKVYPAPVITTTSITNTTCASSSDGSATVSASSPGTSPVPTFTYLWDSNAGSQTTATASNLAAGTYTVTVTQVGQGCSNTHTVTVGVTSDTTPPTAVCQPVTVNLDASGNGSITPAQINNGSSDNCTSAGNLVLSLDKTTFNTSNVGTNTVTLTVKDEANNTSTCQATVTVVYPVDCSITGSQTIWLEDFAGYANGTYQDIDGLPNDWTTSSNSTYFSVQNEAMTGNNTLNTLVFWYSEAIDVTSWTNLNIKIDAYGATALDYNEYIRFDYSVNSGSSWVPFDNNSQIYDGFAATTACSGIPNASTVIIRVGVISNASGEIHTFDNVHLTGDPALQISAVLTNVTCNGGSDGVIVASASGTVTTPYEFKLNASPYTSYQTSGTFSGLTAGTYIITAKDNNGVENTKTVTITQPAVESTPNSTLSVSDVSICNPPSGSVIVTISNSESGVHYEVKNLDNSSLTNPPIGTGTGGDLNLTLTGADIPTTTTTYKVVASTASGCISIDMFEQATITVTTTAPPTGSATQDFCSALSPKVSNISVSGSNIIWYNAASGGSVVLGTTSLISGTTYYASQTVNGCESGSRLAVTVVLHATPTVTSVTHGVICGSGTATLHATASAGVIRWYAASTGGLPLYTGGDFTTPSISATTSYWVEAVNYGCVTSIRSQVIANVYALPTITLGSNPVICYGSTTASLPYSATTGHVYSIDFDAAANTALFSDVTDVALPGSSITIAVPSNVAAGTYNGSLTVKSTFSGCVSNVYPITVTVNTAQLTNLAVSDALICSPIDDDVTITVSGAQSGVTYELKTTGGDSFSLAITGTGTGADLDLVIPQANAPTSTTTYKVVSSGIAGCGVLDLTDQPTVTVDPEITITVDDVTNKSSCIIDNGAISVSVSGGTGTYSYSWTGPNSFTSTSEDLTGLATGIYVLTVTDGLGCQKISNNISISDPGSMTLSNDSQTNVTCYNGSDGSLTVSVSGGTSPYDFNWAGPDAYTSTTNDQTSNTISSLKAGDYTLTVTDDGGCSRVFDAITITQPTEISLAINTLTPASCFGGSDGAISVTVSGGTGGYSYSWTGPNGFISTSEDISGLKAGNYILTVTDGSLCPKEFGAITVSEATEMTLTTNLITNTTCNGGSNGAISITVSNGTPGYTYSWTGPNSYTSTSEDISGLEAGDYTLTVTDANGCVKPFPAITVSEPDAITRTVDLISDISCYGETNGAISVTINGGTPGYTYVWSGPNGYEEYTQDISDLEAGSYTLTVTDNNSCSQSFSAITINEPSDLSIITDLVTNVSCYGGSSGAISVSVSGGVGGYTYSWTGPAGYTSTSEDISGLSVGNYTLTVTDGNSCYKSYNAISVTQPSQIFVSAVVTNASTIGGTDGAINITASGGTISSGYTYSWTGTGVSPSAEDQTGLSAGTYEVTVTDDNGCSIVKTYVVTDPTSSSVNCSYVVQDNFGTTAYSNNDGNIAFEDEWTETTDGGSATTGYIQVYNSALAIGSFNTAVTQTFGTSSVSRTIDLTGISSITVSYDYNKTYSSNKDNYTITFSVGGNTVKTYSVVGTAAISGSESFTITSGLSSATDFTFQLSGSGRSNIEFDNFQVTFDSDMSVNSTSTHVSCNGDTDGAILLEVSGARGTVSYSWTGPNSYSSTNEDISGLGAGTYTVTVTNSGLSGTICSTNLALLLTEPNAIENVYTLTANPTAICVSGSSTLSLSGSEVGVNYQLRQGVTWVGSAIAGTGSGISFAAVSPTSTTTYNVLAINANTACTIQVTDTEQITVNPLPSEPTASASQSLCFGSTVANLSASAGTGEVVDWYSVSNGGSALESGTVLSNGTYYAEARNTTTGCVSSSRVAVSVTIKSLPTASVSGSTTICSGNNTNITITLTGTGPWDFTYTDGSTPVNITGQATSPYTLSVSPSTTTTYSVIAVSDATTCSGTNFGSTATITVNTGPSTSLAISDATICNPAGDNAIITITSAENGVTYELQTLAGASLNPAVTGTGTGADLNLTILQANVPTTTTTYKVVASGISGCSAVDLTDQPTVVVDNTPPTILDCPSNITVNVDPGLCSAVVSWTAPTANDNCGIASFTSTHSPGATFATGTTTVTYTAIDTNGNTNTVPCSFTVTVNDNIDPVINNCPSNTTVSTLNDIPVAETTAGGIGATDNCGISTVTHNDVTSLSCPRTVTRTYTVTDINGRQTTCQQVITITNAPCIDALLCTTSTSTNLITGSPSSGTGTLYTQTIAVCSNTTYEVKLTGVTGTTPFNFDVILDGDHVNDDAMYNSGSTYGFKFKTGPSATSVDLSLVNNDANSLTVSAISFAHCGPTVSITLTTEPECTGELAEVTASVTGSGSYVYQWEESANGGLSWSDISGETSTVLSFNSWTEGTRYRIVVSETTTGLDNTSCSIQSNTVSISPTDSSDPVYQEAFKNAIDPVHTGGNYTYTACDDGTNTFAFLSLDETDLIDNCNAFGDLIKTYSITNGINDITNENGDASAYEFPVGTSSVVYTAEDEKGNVGSFTFTVVVNTKPVLTDITTDGTVSADGSGYKPYQGSQHTYTVDGGTATSGSNYTWKVFDKDNTELTEGNSTTFSISTSNPAAVIITWGGSIPVAGNDYKIVVRETNSTTGCFIEKELTVTILENTFNATVENQGDACHTPQSSNTLIDWNITKTGGADTWYFSYKIFIDDVEINYATEGITPIDVEVTGTSFTLDYLYPNTTDAEKILRFEIYDVHDMHNTNEINLLDNSDEVTLFEKPAIQFE